MTASTAALARHAAGVTASPAVAHRLRMLLFDYLAIATAGGVRPAASAALAAVRKESTGGSCVEGRPDTVGAESAALVNGIASHSLELDDTHEESSTHPGVVIWPAVIALVDGRGATMADVLDAATAGYDVMTAVGVHIGAAQTYARGFHPTAVSGALGAAAAAARVLGLDERATGAALSIAADLAAGSLAFLSDGSWTKRLNAGAAAATGVRAARLAQAGFVAPLEAVEGSHGLLALYGAGAAGGVLRLEAGAGVLSTSVKFYACCRYMHGVMDLLCDLHHESPGLHPDDVESISVAVIEAGQALVSIPAERKLTVDSPVDAQFNMPFGAALALTRGSVRLADFDDAVALASELSPWMAKVHSVTSPSVEAAYPGAWTADVSLALADGRTITRSTPAFRGSPDAPPTWPDLLRKGTELIGEQRARPFGRLHPCGVVAGHQRRHGTLTSFRHYI